MRLTKYGQDVWLKATFAAIALEVVCLLIFLLSSLFSLTTFIVLTVLIALLWICIAGFFRDPDRKPAGNLDTDLFSPADGTVRDVTLLKNTMIGNIPKGTAEKKLEDDDSLTPEMRKLFEGTDVVRVGIFLSVFSVHVNRVPAKMKVVFKTEKSGSFFDARDPRAIKENESVTIGGEGEVGPLKFNMAVKQISGAVAKRIVCPVSEGQIFQACELYGMIKFGSRTELYLPCDKFEILVKCGDSVSGGRTPVARIKSADKQ